MILIEDFDIDEEALGQLCPSALKIVMKKIEEVARLRRERRSYLAEADKVQDDEKKYVLEHLAQYCKDRILALMPFVGIYERGRKRMHGIYV
jgi:hypothetical protein